MKKTRNEAIKLAEEQGVIGDSEMKTLLDAAMLLRKSIKKCKKWEFIGSDENIPMELYSFFPWVIQGPNNLLSAKKKSSEVHKRVMSLTQSTVSMCLTERQVRNKKSGVVRLATEMPQQLAIGLYYADLVCLSIITEY